MGRLALSGCTLSPFKSGVQGVQTQRAPSTSMHTPLMKSASSLARYRAAYPRFKSEITLRELADVYTPSPEEQAFARRQGRTLQGRLAVLVLVKTAQRLGYFVKLAEVPPSIVALLGLPT